MTISKASDTFTRADQSGLGTASDGETWNVIAGSATLSIATNEGHLTNGAASAEILYLGTNTVADAEVLIRFKLSATAAEFGIILRGDGTGANLYRTRQKNGTLNIRKTVASVNTDIAATSFTLTIATFYWMRFRVSGTNLYVKIWQDGSGEPASWTLTATDSSVAGAGRYGIYASPTVNTQTEDFDNYTVNIAPTLTTQTQAKFFTRFTGLTSITRSKFYMRMTGIQAQTLSKFYMRMTGLIGKAVSKFIIFDASIRIPLKPSFTSIKQIINAKFSEALLAQPNTTIIVQTTVTDSTGAAINNLTSVSVSVLFPDGTIGIYTGGYVASSAGVYQITYITKSPGLNREMWSYVAFDGSVAQYLNVTPVAY